MVKRIAIPTINRKLVFRIKTKWRRHCPSWFARRGELCCPHPAEAGSF